RSLGGRCRRLAFPWPNDHDLRRNRATRRACTLCGRTHVPVALLDARRPAIGAAGRKGGERGPVKLECPVSSWRHQTFDIGPEGPEEGHPAIGVQPALGDRTPGSGRDSAPASSQTDDKWPLAGRLSGNREPRQLAELGASDSEESTVSDQSRGAL